MDVSLHGLLLQVTVLGRAGGNRLRGRGPSDVTFSESYNSSPKSWLGGSMRLSSENTYAAPVEGAPTTVSA